MISLAIAVHDMYMQLRYMHMYAYVYDVTVK